MIDFGNPLHVAAYAVMAAGLLFDLVGCIGLGFLLTARIAKRWYTSDQESSSNVI